MDAHHARCRFLIPESIHDEHGTRRMYVPRRGTRLETLSTITMPLGIPSCHILYNHCVQHEVGLFSLV